MYSRKQSKYFYLIPQVSHSLLSCANLQFEIDMGFSSLLHLKNSFGISQPE